jgi:fructose-bisphosphate aldolase class II
MSKIVTTKELLASARKKGVAVVAFNVNNMELVQAITQTANEMKTPVILQVTSGARKYAGDIFIRKLVEAAVETIDIPVALHLDHGDGYDACKSAVDSGFTSVMIDGSHLSLEENIALTKRVVDYAHKHGVSVEGELGKIAGIEDNVSSDHSAYTDPDAAKEFVAKTGVDALAISIGTAHGAFKYKPGSDPNLRFDILEQIHRAIPNTPLVLHGASSVTPEDVKTINKFGGKITDAMGVSEDKLAKAIPLGVTKINVDSDLRLALTAGLREYFAAHPDHFDPRQYMGAARNHVKEIVKKKLEYFSCKK